MLLAQHITSSNQSHGMVLLLIVAATFTLSALLFASSFKRRSIRLAYVATDALRGVALAKVSRFKPMHGWFTWLTVASLVLPIILIFALYMGFAKLLGFDDYRGIGELITLIRNGRGTEGSMALLALLSGQFGIYLVQIFYPMLVFATTVSLYYREHMRPTLSTNWRPWRETAAEPQATSAP